MGDGDEVLDLLTSQPSLNVSPGPSERFCLKIRRELERWLSREKYLLSKACQPEVDPQNPGKRGWREKHPTPPKLSSDLHMCAVAHTYIYINKLKKKKAESS